MHAPVLQLARSRARAVLAAAVVCAGLFAGVSEAQAATHY